MTDAGGASPAELAPPDAAERSLSDDLTALFDDGKTYFEAELQFQKTRASFALTEGRQGAVFGVVAVIVLHLALVALVVGALIALGSEIGPWGATAIVVGVLIVVAVVFGVLAKRHFAKLARAFAESQE
ncbi:MAG: phage holin family protein [Tsuneonella sp.]